MSNVTHLRNLFIGTIKIQATGRYTTVENCVRLKGWSTTTSFGVIVSCLRSYDDISLSLYVHHGRSKLADWTFLSTRSTPSGQWNEKQFDGLPCSLLLFALVVSVHDFASCKKITVRIASLSLSLSLSPRLLSLFSRVRIRSLFANVLWSIHYWIFIIDEATSRFRRRTCVVNIYAHVLYAVLYYVCIFHVPM